MTRIAVLAWPAAQARAREGATLLLPVGATEQHGPHLPLTTDTDVAVAVADRAARLTPGAVVAPALAFGASGEHEDFAGTLSIGEDAVEAVLVELVRSASRHFTRVVIVSTHGGNGRALGRALARLEAEGHPVAAWVPSWTGDLHAGRMETSLMLAIAPSRVDLSAAAPGDRRSAAALMPLLRRHGVRAVSANGVLGDPAGATVGEGERLLDEAARELAAIADPVGGAATAGRHPARSR